VNQSTTFKRHPDLLETTLDNEVVLMSIERGSYFGLENTGKRIWQLLETPQTLAQLQEALGNEYEAPPDVIARDVAVFLQKMLDNGVVTTE
jgi:hypothetical protein